MLWKLILSFRLYIELSIIYIYKKDLSGWGTVTLNDEDEEDGMPGKLIELWVIPQKITIFCVW